MERAHGSRARHAPARPRGHERVGRRGANGVGADPESATLAPFRVTDVAFVAVQLILAVLLPLRVAVSVADGSGVTVAVRVTLPPGPVATSV